MPPGRVLPQHSFFFGAPATWPQTLRWQYNNADAPGPFAANVAATVQQIADGAAKWSAVCGITIVYDGETSMVPMSLVNGGPDRINVVGWKVPEGGVQAATQVWSDSPPGAVSILVDSDIILSPALVTTPQLLDTVIAHEWGHALGLGHTPVANALMSGPPDTAYSNASELAPDDIQGCRCLYGLPTGMQAGFVCSLPSKMDFGAVTVGAQSAPQQLDVTNNGSAAFTMGSIQMQGDDFRFTSNQCAFGMTLSPGASCAIGVAATPSVVNFRYAEAIINTSDGPYRVPLSVVGVAVPPPPLNLEGAWWNAPADSESGWGLTLAHQDDVIFATWFTYSSEGKAMWLSMSAFRTGTDTYTGTLYWTTGPPLSTEPFDSGSVQRAEVGVGTLSFSDADRGTFAYTVNGMSQTKSITRLAFGPLPTCTFGAPDDPTRDNTFQGNWWTASGAESGWGVYLTHQGDTIFTSWFTYDADGSPMWLSATANRISNAGYRGDVIRTTGPPYNAVPFDSQSVGRSTIGSLALTFTDASHVTFEYSVLIGNPSTSVSRTKALAPLIFRPPGSLCEQ